MNAPNPSVRFAGAPRSRVLQFLGDPGGMLDKFTVKIHDVEATVGAGCREHAVEPGVGRGKEIFFNYGAFGDEGRAVRDESSTLNQVVHRFADEEVAVVVRPERVAAIDGRAARGGEVIRRLWNEQRGW